MIDCRINLAIKEDFGLNFAMANEYFFIFDNESIWKIEENKLMQKLILNNDFQFLFSSNRIPDEKIELKLNNEHKENDLPPHKTTNKSERTNIKTTDFFKIFKGTCYKNTAYIKKLNLFVENKKILENENSKNNRLIYLKLIIDKKKNTIKIETYLNDLKLNLNISTLARLKVYFSKISDIYSNITTKEILLQKTLDKIKQMEKERIKKQNNQRFKGLVELANNQNNYQEKKF